MKAEFFFQPYCEKPISIGYHAVNLDFPAHYHTAFETVFVLDGNVSLFTDSQTIKLNTGDIALIPSLLIHGYASDSKSESCTGVFQNETFIDVENFISVNAARNVILLRDLPEDKLELITDALKESTYYQSINDMPMSIIYGKIFLMHLFRAAKSCGFEAEPCDIPKIKHTQEILIFIQEHYREKISLDTLSKSLKLNKYTISKIINKNLGVSFPELLNKYRLLEVCRLLETTDLALSSIAEETGFASESTMYRNFQKTFFMSPNEYKQSKNEKSS